MADSSQAVADLLAQRAGLAQRVTMLIRLLCEEAAWHDPAPERKPGANGRPRQRGARRPTLA